MSSAVSSQVQAAKSQAFFADTSRLQELKVKKDDPESIKKVASEFEALILQMLIKSMREAEKSFKSDYFSSDESEYYEEMHDKQMAMSLSNSGQFGLADIMIQQMQQGQNMPAQSNEQSLQPTQGDGCSVHKIPRLTIPIRPQAKAKSQQVENAQIEQPVSFDTPQDFVEKILPYAKTAAKVIGVDPKLLLAQAALETGWGRKVAKLPDGASSHNLFGIKAGKDWAGGKVVTKTAECKDGVFNIQRDSFRAYKSFRDSAQDYVQFINTNTRYNSALRNAATPDTYVQALQEAGYATDPNYAQKIMRVYTGKVLADCNI